MVRRVLWLSMVLLPGMAMHLAGQTYDVRAELLRHAIAGQDSLFDEYRTYELDLGTLNAYVREDRNVHSVRLMLPGYGRFEMYLTEQVFVVDRTVTTVMTDDGVQHLSRRRTVKTFKGHLKGGQYAVRLTIDDNFLFGFIELPKGEELYIQPLWYTEDGAPDGTILVFRASDARSTLPEAYCAVDHTRAMYRNLKKSIDESHLAGRSSVACKEVEIALADDWLMYQKYGLSITNVENHNIGVLNNVQNNYDNDFNDELIFVLTEFWISTCSTCDPWTSSTDPEELLISFTLWGPSGFSQVHDVANLWTNRTFDGPPIGISWVGAVCSNARYLACQDFSNNQQALRTLMAHELGHNFGAEHDPQGSNTIMAPTLVITNNWSTASQNAINSYIASINCLGPCTSGEPPVAGFNADLTSGCMPHSVQYFDNSTGSPTSWQWTFPGGTPSSSSQQNPVVNYSSPGTFDVILEVSNAFGSNTHIESNYITVHPMPTAGFVYHQTGDIVEFVNLSENSTSFLWDFGDGNVSNQTDPVHFYMNDGVYEVTLTATNSCGNSQHTVFIEVLTLPEAGFTLAPESGCASLVVQFQNASSNNAEYFFWEFDGGTPNMSVLENPIVTYHTPGTYSVMLTVENGAGIDVLHVADLINVFSWPQAAFNTYINGLTVQFINQSQDGATYLWMFGDGNTSTQFSPEHEYENGGEYTVTLITSNNCGADTATTNISVAGLPVAQFSQSVTNGCVPLTVMFVSESDGDITEYFWSFPGGNPQTSTEPSPNVIYETPGIYDVQLIVTNALGSDTVYIAGAVTAVEEVTSMFTVAIIGLEVDLVNTSTGATEYEWIIEGISFYTEHLEYNFEMEGIYPVQLIATSPCGSDTSVQVIEVYPIPVAGFNASVTHGCQPLTVQFFNTSDGNPHTFAWIFEGGVPAMSSDEHPTVVYPVPGIYAVQLTITSSGGSDMLVIDAMITVDPLPVAAFTSVQSGLLVEFVNTSENATQYQWSLDGNEFSSDEHPVYEFPDFGMYQITLIAHNVCGSDSYSISLTLDALPVPAFTADHFEGCAPFQVQFTDISQNGATSWEWSFPGGVPQMSLEQHPLVTYAEPGAYDVTLIAGNQSGIAEVTYQTYIQVDGFPLAAFNTSVNGGHVTVANLSSGASWYSWDFGDGTTFETETPEHTYTENGTYQIILIAGNSCGADTVAQEVTVTITSSADVLPEPEVILYPNPNTGSFYIRTNHVSGSWHTAVYDPVGRLVWQDRAASEPMTGQIIVVRDLAQGVYTVLVTIGQRIESFRVVVL